MLQHQIDKMQYKTVAKSNQHIQIKPSWLPMSCANYEHPYKKAYVMTRMKNFSNI